MVSNILCIVLLASGHVIEYNNYYRTSGTLHKGSAYHSHRQVMGEGVGSIPTVSGIRAKMIIFCGAVSDWSKDIEPALH